MKNIKISKLAAVIFTIAFITLGFYQSMTYAKGNNLIDKVSNKIQTYYDNPQIYVSSNGNAGIVLKGTVNTLYDKLRIYEIASDVKGVKKIEDLIDIQANPIPDKEVQQNIVEEMHLNSAILEPDRIKVAVDNGEVILDGTVSYPREREMAETLASWQNGVLGITNNIKVLPYKKAIDDNNLNIILGEILKTHYGLEKGVTYKVNKGVVTLDGTVSSLWAKKNIEDDFFRVLGVNYVKNNLKVSEENI